MPRPTRILILRTGALGDTIVMSVVFQALRNHFPSAWLEALGPVERLRVINTPGLLNRLTSPETVGLAALYAEPARLSDRQRAYFHQFDAMLVYSVDSEKTLQTNLCKICAQPVYAFAPFPPPGENRHITAYLLETLQVLGVHARDLFPEIALPKNALATSVLMGDSGLPVHDGRWNRHACQSHPALAQTKISEPPSWSLCRDLIGNWVAVHPGSGSPHKNWPAENFRQICQTLIHRHQARIALISGPAEIDIEGLIVSGLPPEAVEVIRQPDVLALAAQLRQCQLYLGNDSGISHLAAATGIPTVALFGPSNPQVWRPLGPRVRVLQGDGRPYCQGISIEAVWQAVKAMLA